MAPLKNARHERFAQELAKGKSQTEAYRLAGYSADTAESNAHRLMDNEGVKARIAELQAKVAEKVVKRVAITIESLTDMYLDDRDQARELGQSAAARGCVDSLAKLHGLMIERKETGAPGDFARMTDDELEDFIASREGRASGGANRTGH